MATFMHFQDIKAWQKARQINQILSSLIDQGRFTKHRNLLLQIERSAGSMMDNIAEGFERGGNREFLQFLYIAKGSCGEFRSQLYRSIDRYCILKSEFQKLYDLSSETLIYLQKLINYLEQAEMKGWKYKNRQELSGKTTANKQTGKQANQQNSTQQ
ncbi:MAG TPA: four helix bundle protein [Chitinophagaceae bacterium]|nr:four helix bundle protein [Chitinophagaceae bacterium]